MAKPWLKQPGECYDRRGVPIHPGDLLRTEHYRGLRRQINYLYHVVVLRPQDGGLRMVPVCHLHSPLAEHPDTCGGCPLLSDDMAGLAEVIDGVRVGEWLDWRDRPRATTREANRDDDQRTTR